MNCILIFYFFISFLFFLISHKINKYLNEIKWNGEGCEYYFNGKLKFNGTYLKGKKFKGKEYNNADKLIFDEEYLNGKRWNGLIKDI